LGIAGEKARQGGIRIIHIYIHVENKIYLLECYPKSEKEDFTEFQKKRIKIMIQTLKGGKTDGK